LPTESLTAGEVTIHLHPSSANDLEPTLLGSLLHFLEQLWIVLREPLQLLGLRAHENILWILFNET